MTGHPTPERFVVPPQTAQAQRRAADPRASAWVSANAGAGKTKVLSDRVLRLMLDGAPPGRILCLTFTKAAAANMAIRVFDRLGRWVTLGDADLAADLEALEGRPPGPARLSAARRLFARAVETPGGLKIETIHAFCERILHMVPFEANVPARFAVLDDLQAGELLAAATRAVLGEAARHLDPALADALDRVSIEAGGEALIRLVRAAVRERAALDHPGGLPAVATALRAALTLKADETAASLRYAMLHGGIPPDDWPALAARLQASRNKTDRERGDALALAWTRPDPAERLALYRTLFFTEAGKPRAACGTKALDEALRERLAAEQGRLLGLDDRLKAVEAFERTLALLTLAGAVRRRIETQKARLGALDFDDLIARTLDLLRRGDAEWILYKLDRGIDHILVDEAQDTNPDQWEILRAITADFTAGAGARGGTRRTVFAVGDPKQSIYGFQGAEPRKFEESRRHWDGAVRGARQAFADVRLTLSFRSVQAVLSAVDHTFAHADHFRGLGFDDEAVGTVHETARPGVPGRVELWPVVRPVEAPDPDAWARPVDEPEAHAPAVVVAARVARAVRDWTQGRDEGGRRWRPGEVLVLVRKRGAAFKAVIRALKAEGVPVAGADRLDIADHIAVQDLVAAGRAALLPDDDLTLAAALKSPLVGLADDDLLRLAAGRPEGEALADALHRHAEAGDPAALLARRSLETWADLARAHGPFGFYATLLGPLGGRRALVARLGGEAGDAIDAFLCLTHEAAGAETPSLTAFLARFAGSEHEVKRDLETDRDELRVMTVHGAKGLEAGIVVVLDGCETLGRDPPLIPLVPDFVPGRSLKVWAPGSSSDSGIVADARGALRARGLEEHNRLLYVAMTRAKERLVIAPFCGARDAPGEAWCEMIRRGLAAKAGGLVRAEAAFGPIDVWRDGEPAPTAPAAAPPAPPAVLPLPAWLTTPVAAEPEPAPPLRPSGALAAADRGLRAADAAFAPDARLRGTLVHTLLERLPALPPERRQAAAEAYLAARAGSLEGAVRARIVADALAVLGHPDLAALFGPGSRAEVAIAGPVVVEGVLRPVLGQIDRLAVLPDRILVADFKTTARPPRPETPTPPAYRRQLGLYRALLQAIYPGLPVHAFLVWTAGPVIRPLDADALAAALEPAEPA